MGDPSDSNPQIDEIKELLQNNDSITAATKILEYLNQQNNVPLNIGITGESGSGKSTFVNAFRGIDNEDEEAARTGCVETTMEVTPYLHPNYPNVILWDLPGIGTTKFPTDKYLEHIGFEKFDFFIIISADRFRENDVKLAQDIQKMGKKFYFVRSKIDHNIRDEERSKRKFDLEKTLDLIRKYCIKGLQEHGFETPQVFLVSCFDLHLYDFHLLQNTLDKELPAHKRNALLFAMPNINLEIINKKKEAFQAQIILHAFQSVLGAVVLIPRFSICVDVALMVNVVTKYVAGFGLDIQSLKRLAESTGVQVSDLTDVIKSPLAAKTITIDLMKNALGQIETIAALTAAEEASLFIPFFGIPIAATLSCVTTYKALNHFLDVLAEDAQRVFRRALGLTTSV